MSNNDLSGSKALRISTTREVRSTVCSIQRLREAAIARMSSDPLVSGSAWRRVSATRSRKSERDLPGASSVIGNGESWAKRWSHDTRRCCESNAATPWSGCETLMTYGTTRVRFHLVGAAAHVGSPVERVSRKAIQIADRWQATSGARSVAGRNFQQHLQLGLSTWSGSPGAVIRPRGSAVHRLEVAPHDTLSAAPRGPPGSADV